MYEILCTEIMKFPWPYSPKSLVNDPAGKREPRRYDHSPEDLLCTVPALGQISKSVYRGLIAIAAGMLGQSGPAICMGEFRVSC